MSTDRNTSMLFGSAYCKDDGSPLINTLHESPFPPPFLTGSPMSGSEKGQQTPRFFSPMTPSPVWPNLPSSFLPTGTFRAPSTSESNFQAESPNSLLYSSTYDDSHHAPSDNSVGSPSTPGDMVLPSSHLEPNMIHASDNWSLHNDVSDLDNFPGFSNEVQPLTYTHYESYNNLSELSNSPNQEMLDALPFERIAETPESIMPMVDTLVEDPHTSYDAQLAGITPGQDSLQRTSPEETTAETPKKPLSIRPKRKDTGSGRASPKKVIKSLSRGQSKRPVGDIRGSPKEMTTKKQRGVKDTRAFVCIFGFAGCASTFANKNEWKRHVSTQHTCHEFYYCDHDQCAESMPTSARRRAHYLPKKGGIFNRKDLYSQHIKRMHKPEARANSTHSMDEHIRHMQKTAYRKRCDLPSFLQCPAANCDDKFASEKAWDEWMEHIARHLERAAKGDEPPVQFGLHEHTLIQWAESPGVEIIQQVNAGVWKLTSPLKPNKKGNQDKDTVMGEDASDDEY